MSKGNNINVGNIEEDIKRCKELIKPKNSEWIGLSNQNAIEIVLANLEALCDMQMSADRELENARKINEEHKKTNAELRKKVKELDTKNDELLKDLYSANCIISDLSDSIPKQKIKEKIEELTNTKGDFATYIATSERIKVLQELLQESKDK